MHRRGLSLLCILALCLVACGCANVVTGKGSAGISYFDVVPGVPAKEGATGLRPGVADAHRDIKGTQGEDAQGKEVDRLAADALDDIETFWTDKLPKYFKKKLQRIDDVTSYDPRNPDAMACGTSVYKIPNAMYCFKQDAIAWDRAIIVPYLDRTFPPIAIVVVLAHEYGHRVQTLTKIVDENTPSIVLEQQADCFAGFFIRWVVEGHSKHFQIDTASGLNTIMAALLALRDPPQAALDTNYKTNEHGSGFDRVTAFEMGFANGGDACAGINRQEIDKRRQGLPIIPTQDDTNNGNLDITAGNINKVVQTIESFYQSLIPTMPKHDLSGVDKHCPGQPPPTDPGNPPAVLYCEATNTVSMDLPALAQIGAPPANDGAAGAVTGDTTAFGLIASRYALAYLKTVGQPRTGPAAGLAAACLTGAWMRSIVKGKDIQFAPGDLDKVTSEILHTGGTASDITGRTVPSGLTRFNALRTGVIGPEDVCVKDYPARI